MKEVTIYEYAKCNTCRKALKYLEANQIPYQKIPIVDQPPPKKVLETALTQFDGAFKKLFNTSGLVYREMKISQKIKTMTADDALALLAANGKLVKRPFVLTEKGVLAGFNEATWDTIFKG
ncbi:MAG: Spx/MgsR family RNA polymerase-binding regulatory protein [Nitrospiria bacterium]